MSWSITIPVTPVRDFQAAIRGASGRPENESAKDQVDLAIEIAVQIVESGVIGNETKKVHATLSGHANPDHEPRSGWVNDMVYISIQQAVE